MYNAIKGPINRSIFMLKTQQTALFLKVCIISNHPSHHPTNGVPDADAKGQHDSWPAQGRLFEFPRKDADCEDARYDANDNWGTIARFYKICKFQTI